MKTPLYTYLGIAGFVLFVVFHFVFGWNHPEESEWQWIHELSEALLVICGLSYWVEEIIKTAIRKAHENN